MGDYTDDERHGEGTMKWIDGSQYKGNWEKGIQHGKGLMVFPDGTVKEGLFENNIYKGPPGKTTISPLKKPQSRGRV